MRDSVALQIYVALRSQGLLSDVGLEVRYVELELREERVRYLPKAVNVFLLLDSWIIPKTCISYDAAITQQVKRTYKNCTCAKP